MPAGAVAWNAVRLPTGTLTAVAPGDGPTSSTYPVAANDGCHDSAATTPPVRPETPCGTGGAVVQAAALLMARRTSFDGALFPAAPTVRTRTK